MKDVLYRIVVIGICLISNSLWANPAGVIPYACFGGKTLVLLAFDPAPGRQGYGAFGGRSEPGEAIFDTAARELREETRCAFDSPQASELKDLPVSRTGEFYSYVAQVEYTSALSIEQHICGSSIERFGWQWFELESLLAALRTKAIEPMVQVYATDLRVKLWDEGVKSMRQAVSDGFLDGTELCR
jgi:8-oxo-dGTP pyrophosphatase MutT (NUDIX family)